MRFRPLGSIVTNDDIDFDEFDFDPEGDLARAEQTLSVRTETRRYGKTVTVVEGFDPSLGEDLRSLASELKSALGTGGTATEDGVELQGDQTDRVPELLRERGFAVED